MPRRPRDLRKEPHWEEHIGDYFGNVEGWVAENTLQRWAQTSGSFPIRPYLGSIIAISPEKKEYINGAAFWRHDIIADAWRGPFNMGGALMLLTADPGTLSGRVKDNNIIGRWYGNRVTTAWRYTKLQPRNGEHSNDWLDAVRNNHKDISWDVKMFMNVQLTGLTPYAKTPNDFRRIINAMFQPLITDYTWMDDGHLWALRDACEQMPKGTWKKMREWLLRQKLSDEARLALGGRPGRLAENQTPAENRKFRKVNIERTEGTSE